MQDEKTSAISRWLGTGSINIFGLPMSGKDTVGTRLAAALGAQFLSSGTILRANSNITDTGALTPTDKFYDIILPHFSDPTLTNKPLILSSIGRWGDEKLVIMETLKKANHPLRATILLDITENEVWARWKAAKILDDRGDRTDDRDSNALKTRIAEFNTKTFPDTVAYYQQIGILIPIPAAAPRNQVFNSVLEKLYNFTLSSK